jgi:hypothetical protein
MHVKPVFQTINYAQGFRGTSYSVALEGVTIDKWRASVRLMIMMMIQVASLVRQPCDFVIHANLSHAYRKTALGLIQKLDVSNPSMACHQTRRISDDDKRLSLLYPSTTHACGGN